MKITALTENTSQAGLPTEHGLSLFIETTEHRILFDTGQSELFAENAKRLKVDLGIVDIAVISHGHFDHGGGLKTFLQINSVAPVYISRYAFEPYYRSDGEYIGLDLSLKENDRFHFTEDVTEIGSGLTLYSCNDRKKAFDLVPSGLGRKENDVLLEDDFRHEQYLLIEENGKRVLLSGCSHKGIRNLVRWFRPDVLVGGFHFFRLPVDQELQSYGKDLDAFPTKYYTCHCTGTEQYECLAACMRDLHYLSAGQTITI